MDVRTASDHDLYRLWAECMTELQRRGMLANGSPLGWATERLVCDRLGLDPTPANTHYRDAVGTGQRQRYQIKGRTADGRAPNVNGLQDPAGQHFDFLVVVIFEEDRLSVQKAFRMRHDVVQAVAKETNTGRNAYGFRLTADITERDGVEDITNRLT